MKEALKLALEALESALSDDQPYIVKCGEAITAIKEALAQPDAFEQGRQEGMKQERALWELSRLGQEIEAQPEPAAWITPDGEGFRIRFSPPTSDVPLGWGALYTAPPQRPWVGLTEVDILAESKHWKNPEDFMDGVYWAETTLKEKNT